VDAQQAPDPARRLAALGQVWGLLKYFHGGVAARTDWDDVLITAVPRFKTAETREAVSREVMALVGQAGPGDVFRDVPAGKSPDTPLGATFRWIDDATLFELETSRLLRAVVLAHKPGSNRYVAPVSGVHNPDFTNDQAYYASDQYPDEATRLLALFRFWNMVQYFFPHRDVMDRDWIDVLPELVLKHAQAGNAVEYHLAVMEMTASINDAHASTSSAVITNHFGLNTAPIQVRLVEGRTVVTRVFPRLLGAGIDLRVGDEVTHVAGVPVETVRTSIRRFVNGSNEASLERNIHYRLLLTNEPRLSVTVQGADARPLTWDVNTVTQSALSAELTAGGDMSALLAGNVGYVDMGRLQVADAARVMAQLRNTRGIIFDVRNYPNGTLYTVSNYLNPSLRPFVKFTEPDFANPGNVLWTAVLQAGPGSPNAWNPTAPASYTYTGRVAVLINQETQSQAEYTVMALRTAPDVTIIGSQTAGADGNVSLIRLPGGISTYFSGLGVFYPDGRPTQRIGIVPDIVVQPTLRGLREGRDEVLEAALQFLR